MKLLFDLFPVLLFFAAYKLAGIYTATAVLMAASLAQTLIFRVIKGKFEATHVVALVLILLFGSATLLFHTPAFIEWKPTVISGLFAAALLGTRYIAGRNLIARFMGSRLSLPDEIWDRLNVAWAVYFMVTAASNAFVILSFDTSVWVSFHTFGMSAITGSFVIGQTLYLTRHMRTAEAETD
jgi:intracellular septation protein